MVIASESEEQKPNIILVMADDMGFECLSSNGCVSYHTPFLDKLSAEGIKFTYAFSQPLCTPSRVKLMTGKYNYRNYKAFGYLDINEQTIGNLLKKAGYKTCVVGKWQLNGLKTKFETQTEEMLHRPYHFGFDEYCLWNFLGDSEHRYASPKLFQNGKQLEGLEDAYGPDIVSNYALDFIEKNKDKPFFLYYPMILVHDPFVPTPDSKEWSDKNLRYKQNNRFFKDMVEYTDKIINKLISRLEELELAENTIFIFTCDNGTNYKIVTQTVNGPYHGGKGTMPNAGTHVPLLIYSPKIIEKGFKYSELFEFSDFLPTLAELAGIPVPAYTDGKSLAPLILGDKQENRKTIFIHYDPLKGGGSERWYGRFIRNKEYKLYNDGRFYSLKKDELEKNPIQKNDLTNKELKYWEMFQQKLDETPPHYFKQPAEYKK
ncbi:sulfatase-like hydrolase/transferase [Maribellus comscasis]|uniref:Sulfatase-like hydrolase/transferase n=2 Tax=Maribellus comscasis TaxID=2681766 RepID=A0A6I6JYS4_9BACT|nr:sulfatase-like hydrolase/transferase [Maribellus comscasis]